MNSAALLWNLIAFAAAARAITFDGHSVRSFSTQTKEQVALLQSHLQNRSLALSLWSHQQPHVGANDIHVLVPAQSKEFLLRSSLLQDVPNRLIIENVQPLVEAERAHSLLNSAKLEAALAASPNMTIDATTFFSDYQALSTIDAYMKSLPGVTALNVSGITTYQGRPITVYRFGSGPKHIVFNGGIHAREWIAPAVASYIVYQVTTDSKLSYLLQNFTFHCVPVLNPDGYVETRVGNRFQRKNMEPNPCTSAPVADSPAIGTDGNRNFDYKWSLPGASGDPCDQTYYGESAFSSAEARGIANYIKSLPAGDVVSYIDFHSYSQLWMYPNGWSCDVKVKDDAILFRGSQLAVDALRSAGSGTAFRNGAICPTIYQASGSSSDYFYNVLGVTFSYSVELRDTGEKYGFILPANMIVPSGKETTAAVVALWDFVATSIISQNFTKAKADSNSSRSSYSISFLIILSVSLVLFSILFS